MSTDAQRVLLVQDASRELCIVSMRRVLSVFSLRHGDVVRILGIRQGFSKKGCVAWLERRKFVVNSSATINKQEDNFEEETLKARIRYFNCPEYKAMVNIASALQLEFDVVVEAGLLKEMAVEHAKRFLATYVILIRLPTKDVKYFRKNLSCGIYRMTPNRIKLVASAQADKLRTKAFAIPEPGKVRTAAAAALVGLGCSVCKNGRPQVGLRRRFLYAELHLATNGFCPQNLMADHGKNVYLGLLNDQRKALIRESPSASIKEDQFKREVKVLEDIAHENVAFLIGSCSEGPHHLLVYEYICNGSLNKLLSEKSEILTWERRISIAHGAANGLEYLHREKIYGGIKPSNILLNHDYHPLISYYGLTMNQYEALGQSSDATTLRTFEYLAPEYQDTGIDLSKADVYSFGVVLLELLTGRKTMHDTNGQSFLRWARPLLRQKKYMELIDPMLQDNVDLFQLYWLVRVTYRCLNWEPKNRYPMKKVVEALSGIMNRSGVEDFSPTGSEW